MDFDISRSYYELQGSSYTKTKIISVTQTIFKTSNIKRSITCSISCCFCKGSNSSSNSTTTTPLISSSSSTAVVVVAVVIMAVVVVVIDSN